MTIRYLMDTLNKAHEWICKIAEGEFNLSEDDLHDMADIMAIMYEFIADTEFSNG